MNEKTRLSIPSPSSSIVCNRFSSLKNPLYPVVISPLARSPFPFLDPQLLHPPPQPPSSPAKPRSGARYIQVYIPDTQRPEYVAGWVRKEGRGMQEGRDGRSEGTEGGGDN